MKQKFLNVRHFQQKHFLIMSSYLQHDSSNPEDPRKAYKKERDPGVRARMPAASMACMNNESTHHAAGSPMQCPSRVSFWVERFAEGGLDALRDLPKRDRPPKVGPDMMEGIWSGASARSYLTTPNMF